MERIYRDNIPSDSIPPSGILPHVNDPPITFASKIPSCFMFKKAMAPLVAPEGISMDSLSDRVANSIAKTIKHEAAHGHRWANYYATGALRLQDVNTGEEERIAEDAENKLNLETDITPDILDESEQEETMTAEQLLDKALMKANSLGDMYIPRDAVEIKRLPRGVAGQFEMIQGPDIDMPTSDNVDVPMAWKNNGRTLMVDVEAAIDQYNRVVGDGYSKPPTYQDDGTTPDYPGVSQPHMDQSAVQPQPSAGAWPTRDSIPAR